jgi:hypothetical protein
MEVVSLAGTAIGEIPEEEFRENRNLIKASP